MDLNKINLSRRVLKKEVVGKVGTLSVEDFLEDTKLYPEQSVINALFSCLYSPNEKVRWGAVASFGKVMSRLADKDMEKARVVMRRCMWMLNDESGGIGWGVPEAFAETLACHTGLAEEYTHILVAFMREDGFFLELEPLQRGLLWGIGRVAQVRPDLLKARNAAQHLIPYLKSSDPQVKELAAQALSLLKKAGSA